MHLLAGVVAAALVAACDTPASSSHLLFREGRAVAAAGDSLLAVARAGNRGVLVYSRGGDSTFTFGTGELVSPVHVQEMGGRWFVSDVEGGRPQIVLFSTDGVFEERIGLDTLASAAHQFAVLPDRRIVVEHPDGRLLALGPDSVTTFTTTEQSERAGLMVAAGGGVLHAVPGRHLTLYNVNGNVRWRLEWPWHDRAFVADLAVDAQGRNYVIAGEEGRNSFVTFTLSPTTGEILRWSVPGPFTTFVVDRLGEVRPDTVGGWWSENGTREAP